MKGFWNLIHVVFYLVRNLDLCLVETGVEIILIVCEVCRDTDEYKK